MNFKQFVKKNVSGRAFTDLTNELVRTYLFANGKVVIDNPIALHISKSGHYVARADGVVTFLPYGPNGFIALQFVCYADAPTMNF
jgi:photosystem II stability/assembly factor-like uncharacterized protein